MGKITFFHYRSEKLSVRIFIRHEFIIIFALTIIGLFLRVTDIGFGLPSVSYEEHFILKTVWDMGKANTLNPGVFSWPSLLFYIYLGILKSLWLFGQNEWSTFVLACRWFAAIIGAVTIPVVYIIVRQLFCKYTAIIASIFVVLLPVHIIFSHIARPEFLVPFLFLMTFLFSIYILKTGKFRFYLLATVCAGLATAAKYNGAFAVLIPLAAHILLSDQEHRSIFSTKAILVLVIMPVIAFVVTTPFSLLDFGTFKDGLMFQGDKAGGSTWEVIPGAFRYFLAEMGWVMTLAVVPAIVYTLYRHNRSNILCFVAFLSSLGILVLWTPSRRMLISAMIVMAIYASFTVIKTVQFVGKRNVFLGILVFIILVSSILYYPLELNNRRFYDLSKTSVAEPVFQWLEDNAPAGSRIYWGYVAPVPYITDNGEMRYFNEGASNPGKAYDNDYEAFAADEWDYVIMTESHHAIFDYPENNPTGYDFYTQLYLNSDVNLFEWRFGEQSEFSAPFSQWMVSLYNKRRFILVFKMNDDLIKAFPFEDATISAWQRLENSGGSPTLYVRAPVSAGLIQSVLKFRLPEEYDLNEISSVKLCLYVFDTSGSDLQVLINNGGWHEDTVNWDNAANIVNESDLIAEYQIGEADINHYIKIDISKEIFMQMCSDTSEDINLALRIENTSSETESQWTKFVSKEGKYVEWRPYLEITLANGERSLTDIWTCDASESIPPAPEFSGADWSRVVYQLGSPYNQFRDVLYDYPVTTKFVSSQGATYILVDPKPQKGVYDFGVETHLFTMASIGDTDYLTALSAQNVVEAMGNVDNVLALGQSVDGNDGAGVSAAEAARAVDDIAGAIALLEKQISLAEAKEAQTAQWLNDFALPVLNISEEYHQRLNDRNAEFYEEYRDRLSGIIEKLNLALSELSSG